MIEGGIMAGAAEEEAVFNASVIWAATMNPHGYLKGLCLELMCITPST